MRLFISIDPGHTIRARFMTAINAIDYGQKTRAFNDSLRFSPDENIHLTLCFLGETHESALQPILSELRKLVARHRTFDIESRHLGNFSAVLFLNLSEQPRLNGLSTDLRVALKSAAINYDEKPFRPHITIAYSKDKLSSEILSYIKSIDLEPATALVTGFQLMKSEFGPGGPVYTPIEIFDFPFDSTALVT